MSFQVLCGRDDLMLQCARCKVQKPEEEFYANPKNTGRNGRHSYCKECMRSYFKGRFDSEKDYWYRIKKRHGVTQHEYETMLDEQDGVCALCGASPEDDGRTKRLAVDHDAKTGRVRGLLCKRCNMGIGYFDDDSGRLADAGRYVTQFDPKPRYAIFVGRWQPLHLGHEWLIRQKLDVGVPVLVMIRDVLPDQSNPLNAREVQEIIQVRFGDAVETMVIPDIESVNYGRGVGYEINEYSPPAEVHAISGTALRLKVRENGDWHKYVDPSIWSRIADLYG